MISRIEQKKTKKSNVFYEQFSSEAILKGYRPIGIGSAPPTFRNPEKKHIQKVKIILSLIFKISH